MPEKKVRILITAFDTDKGDFAYNVSKETVRELAEYYGLLPANMEIVTHVFPVDFKNADQRVRDVLESYQPDFVISLGQSPSDKLDVPSIEYERVAHNGKRASEDTPLRPISPKGRQQRDGFYADAMVPNDTMALFQSTDAGRFLCNHLYYRELGWMDAAGKEKNAVFLHLGWPSGELTPDQQSANAEKYPRLYAGHVFELAIAAASIVEVQRAAKDQPERDGKIAPDALSTPDKTALAAIQYQLVRIGLLHCSATQPQPVTGIMNAETREAIRKLEPVPGFLLAANDRIPLGQAMIQVNDYEKRLAQALLQLADPKRETGRTDEMPRAPITPNFANNDRARIRP